MQRAGGNLSNQQDELEARREKQRAEKERERLTEGATGTRVPGLKAKTKTSGETQKTGLGGRELNPAGAGAEWRHGTAEGGGLPP